MAVGEGGLDGVEDGGEVFADVGGEEAEDEDAVPLEEGVFAAVAAPGVFVGEVLGAVEFDGEVGFLAVEVDFHAAFLIEGDGESGVEAEAAAGGWEGLEAAVEEGFAGAAGVIGAGVRLGGVEEEIGEGAVDAVADEAADTAGVVAFPLGFDGEECLDRPAGGGALAGRRMV